MESEVQPVWLMCTQVSSDFFPTTTRSSKQSATTVMGKRKNLHLFLESWVHRLELSSDNTTVTGVCMRDKNGTEMVLKASHEVLLCAGAVDSPRLLLLSGIGPKNELEELGIPCKVDRKGVGENLVDHPESIIMCEFVCTGLLPSVRRLINLSQGKPMSFHRKPLCKVTPPFLFEEILPIHDLVCFFLFSVNVSSVLIFFL